MASIFDDGGIELKSVKPLKSITNRNAVAAQCAPVHKKPVSSISDDKREELLLPKKGKSSGYIVNSQRGQIKRQKRLNDTLTHLTDWSTSLDLALALGVTRQHAQIVIRQLENFDVLEVEPSTVYGGVKRVKAKPGAEVKLLNS